MLEFTHSVIPASSQPASATVTYLYPSLAFCLYQTTKCDTGRDHTAQHLRPQTWQLHISNISQEGFRNPMTSYVLTGFRALRGQLNKTKRCSIVTTWEWHIFSSGNVSFVFKGNLWSFWALVVLWSNIGTSLCVTCLWHTKCVLVRITKCKRNFCILQEHSTGHL